MRVEERLQGLSDALKLVEKDIEHIEELTDLARGTLSFVRNQIEFLQRETCEGREGLSLIEVRCEDCDRVFYILSDMVCCCPYCGSRNTRICADVSVEAKIVSASVGEEK